MIQTRTPRASTAAGMVRTHTNIPPGITEKVYAQLCLQVNLFRWTGMHPITTTKEYSTPISVHVIWWGEEGRGSVFHPRMAHKVGHKQTTTRTTARYFVCVPLPQLHAYLADMRSLFLDVVDECSQLTIGRGRVENLMNLTPEKPISATVAIASAAGVKFGELSVSLNLEQMPIAQHRRTLSLLASKTKDLCCVAPIKNVNLPPKPPQKTVTMGTVEERSFTADDEIPASTDLATVAVEMGTIRDKTMPRENAIDALDGDLTLSPYVTTYSPNECRTGNKEMTKVLQKIQNALEESKRLRDEVICSQADTEVAAAVANAGLLILESSNSKKCDNSNSFSNNNRPLQGILSESLTFETDDFTKISNDIAISSNHLDPLSEMRSKSQSNLTEIFCQLDGDKYHLEDLMAPGQYEDALSGNESGSNSLEIVKSDLDDDDDDDSLFEELVFASHKARADDVADGRFWDADKICDFSNEFFQKIPQNAHTTNNNFKGPQSGGDACELLGINVSFRRVTFPPPVWSAIESVLTVAERHRLRSSTKNACLISNPGNLRPKSARAGWSVKRSSGISRNATSPRRGGGRKTLRQSSSGIKLTESQPESPKYAAQKLEFELEVYLPPDIQVPSAVPTMPSFKRMQLRQGARSKRNGCPRQINNPVILSPCRRIPNEPFFFKATTIHTMEPHDNIELRLCYYKQGTTVGSQDDRILGIIEVPISTLLRVLSEGIEQPTVQHYTGKTVRVRFDFSFEFSSRLSRSMNPANSAPILPEIARQCYLFLNVEPVFTAGPAQSVFVAVSQSPREKMEDYPNTQLLTNWKDSSMHSVPLVIDPPQILCASPTNLASPRLDMLLTVCEARDLQFRGTSDGLGREGRGVQLVVRTPWATEERQKQPTTKTKRFTSAVAWGGENSPAFHFGLRTTALFNEPLLQRMQKSFIFIEVWNKQMTTSEADELLGLVRLPLCLLKDLYYGGGDGVKLKSVASLLAEENPVILEDAWLPITSPAKGCQSGYIRTRVAFGTSRQINTLMKADKMKKNVDEGSVVDWRCLEFLVWPGIGPDADGHNSSVAETVPSICVEHSLEISIRKLLDFRPDISETLNREFGSTFPKSDCDCFIVYRLHPDGDIPEIRRTDLMPLQIKNEIGETNCRFIMDEKSSSSENGWSEVHMHRFFLRTAKINKHSHRVDGKAFLNWLGKKPGCPGIQFELRLRVYSPRLREVLVARGILPWQELTDSFFSNEHPFLQNMHKHVNWQKCETLHLHLFDIISGQMAARLELVLTYRCKNSLLSGEDVNDERFSSMAHQVVDNLTFIPSTARTGVRMRVNLSSLTGLSSGLTSAESGSNVNPHHQTSASADVSFSGYARMHCLLLMPSSSGTLPPTPRLLSTVSSKRLNWYPGEAFAENLKMQLDALLPLSWIVTKSQKRQIGGIPEQEKILTLAEALVYSSKAVGVREDWLAGRVKKPCLVIQVDVWQDGSQTQLSLHPRSTYSSLWGLNYKDAAVFNWCPPDCSHESPMASCRIPLSDILASSAGSLAPRWYPLILSGSISPDGSRMSLGGGVELSLDFTLPQARRRIIHEAASRLIAHEAGDDCLETSKTGSGVKLLQRWGIFLGSGGAETEDNTNSDSVMEDESQAWDTGLDEFGNKYKVFLLKFSAIHLPPIETLLDGTELNQFQQSGFYGFVFARTVFLDFKFQNTELHQIPYLSESGNSVIGCISFVESLRFTVPVGRRLRSYLSKNCLEIQIWIQWGLNTGDNSPANSLLGNNEPPFRTPPPRFIGSVQLPLLQLIYGKPLPPYKEVTQIPNPTVRFAGTPDSFFWSSRGSEPLLVYPIFRSSLSNLHGAWLAVSLEMIGTNLPSTRLTGHGCVEQSGVAGKSGILSWAPCLKPPPIRDADPSKLQKSCNKTRLFKSVDEGNENETLFFPAHVIIERASCLVPSKSLMQSDVGNVETFATFTAAYGQETELTNCTEEEKKGRQPGSGSCSRVAVTPLAKDATSPVWNYQRYACLPITMLSEESSGLAVDIWHKLSSVECQCTERPKWNQPQFLGTAVLNLGSLAFPSAVGTSERVAGLEFVHGWYNIIDRQGEERGQLLAGVYPLHPDSSPRFHGTSRAPKFKPPVSSVLFSTKPDANSLSSSHDVLEHMQTLLALGSDWPGQDHGHRELDKNKMAFQLPVSTQASNSEGANMSVLINKLHNQLGELDAMNIKMKQRLCEKTDVTTSDCTNAAPFESTIPMDGFQSSNVQVHTWTEFHENENQNAPLTSQVKYEVPLPDPHNSCHPKVKDKVPGLSSVDLTDIRPRVGKGAKPVNRHEQNPHRIGKRSKERKTSQKGSLRDISAPFCQNLDLPGVQLSPEHRVLSPKRCGSPARHIHSRGREPGTRRVERWARNTVTESISTSWPPDQKHHGNREVGEGENNSQFATVISPTVMSSNWDIYRKEHSQKNKFSANQERMNSCNNSCNDTDDTNLSSLLLHNAKLKVETMDAQKGPAKEQSTVENVDVDEKESIQNSLKALSLASYSSFEASLLELQRTPRASSSSSSSSSSSFSYKLTANKPQKSYSNHSVDEIVDNQDVGRPESSCSSNSLFFMRRVVQVADKQNVQFGGTAEEEIFEESTVCQSEVTSLVDMESHAELVKSLQISSERFEKEDEEDQEAGEKDEANGSSHTPSFFSSFSSLLQQRRADWEETEKAQGVSVYQANNAVSHHHLQALQLARQAAQDVKRRADQEQSAKTSQQPFGEDPIRRRIKDSLSQMVRKTRSEVEDVASAQPCPLATAQQSSRQSQLSNRALQRAAHIFDMKL